MSRSPLLLLPALCAAAPLQASEVKFSPYVAGVTAFGGSTSNKNIDLIPGVHAPLDDGFNLQNLEFGMLLEFNSQFSFQGNSLLLWDRFDGWDGEIEDAYFNFHPTEDVTIRAGQYLVPFGLENNLHSHQREFIEPPISVVRLLGEDGLIGQGGDIVFPVASDATLRLGLAHARSHSHGGKRLARRAAILEGLLGHEEDHEDEHDEEEEEHDEHEDHHEHAHGRAGGGGKYDVDDAYFDDIFAHARLEWEVAENWNSGFSFAYGENGFGRSTWVAGADLTHDFEIAGRNASASTEVFYRDVHAVAEDGDRGSFSESGILASLGWNFASHWTANARAEWASGNALAGMERRWRLSTNVSHLAHVNDYVDVLTRLQYSYDRLGGFTDEHSVWLQFIVEFGSGSHSHAH